MKRRDDDDYTLDDLVAHERSNMLLVAVLLVGAVLYFSLRSCSAPPAPADGQREASPVVTKPWEGAR